MLSLIKSWFKKSENPSSLIKILVIEDSPVDQKVAQKAIEKGGYHVLIANNAQEGIELAKTHIPDLIILDFQLPDMKGTDVCLRLKHISTTAEIPVLFLTGQDSDANVLDCYEKGAENYLSKPISPSLLSKYINDILRDKKESDNV
jgi:CheY-like chemotaxis protein